MKLYYNKQFAADLEIRTRMESLTLAFEKEEHLAETPRLIDGKETLIGTIDITKHLDEVAGELHNWYYCNC